MNLIDLEPLKLECNFTPPDFIRVDIKPISKQVEIFMKNGKEDFATYHTKKDIQELIKYLNEVVEYMK